MAQPLINGVAYDFGSVEFQIMGRSVHGISEISYEAKREVKNNFGAGYKPVSRSYGRYEFSGKVKLHMEEIEALTKVAPDRDLTKIPPFDVVINFLPVGGIPVTHKLRSVGFMTNGRSMKSGDTLIEQDLELVIGDIEF